MMLPENNAAHPNSLRYELGAWKFEDLEKFGVYCMALSYGPVARIGTDNLTVVTRAGHPALCGPIDFLCGSNGS